MLVNITETNPGGMLEKLSNISFQHITNDL